MGVDAAAYRQVMGRLATGVTVLTTRTGDRHEVMTANAVTSVSLDPVLLLASVGRGCRWGAAARATGRFVVNVLSEEQEELSRWCASSRRHDEPDEVLRHPVRTSASGALVFQEALVAFECRLHSDLPVGDHDLLIGEVQDMWVRDAGAPLVFFAGGYASVAGPLSPAVTLAAACS
jgi:flavin reductase (DIM6/NTAB) family NADH-FMN oxidoreductase RutF